MKALRSVVSDVWVAEQSLRFTGVEVGARMTVIRLPDGNLLLHSPIERSAALAAEVAALGVPAIVIAPNRLHHLYVQPWLAEHAGSRLFVAPGLDAKRKDLKVDGVLGDAPLDAWSAVLDQALVAGAPFTSEVVFFHRPSATLIVSDLLFNVGDESPGLTRAVFRLAGAYGRPATTPLERLLVRDRDAFRRSLTRILDWPIERIVVAHGSVFEGDGRAALARAYDWVLG